MLALGPDRATLVITAIAALLSLVLVQVTLLAAGLQMQGFAAIASLVSAGLVAPPIAWPLLTFWAEAEAARAQLDVLASRDDLTGVFNRRHVLVLADREWARCRRYDLSAAMLMIDVDHFKRVNDRHGHLAGDLMLREIARTVAATLRHPDLLGRFGGEEFIVFLPHADVLGALDVAERIRERVGRLALEWRGETIRSTVSVGVVLLEPHHDSLGTLIADADLAMYAAKHAGRNCVRTAEAAPRLSDRLESARLPTGDEGGPFGSWNTRSR
jgi:diguanylate cyclase